jgi:hypothetical protein
VTGWALILLVVASRHYGVYIAHRPDRADVWNILGAVAIMALATALTIQERKAGNDGNANLATLGVLGFHELPVIAASAAWMVAPWDVPEGVGMLSAWSGLDLARISATVVMLAVAYIVGRKPDPVRPDR